MIVKKTARYSKTALRKSGETVVPKQKLPQKNVGSDEQNWLLGNEPPRK
jgi:hypothetical protein